MLTSRVNKCFIESSVQISQCSLSALYLPGCQRFFPPGKTSSLAVSCGESHSLIYLLWARKIGGVSVEEAFPGGLVGKESASNVGDLGSIPGLGRSLGKGKGYSLQYFGLENSMDLYSPWARKESDMTERLSLTHSLILYI